MPDAILFLAAMIAAPAGAADDAALLKPAAPAAIASAVGDCWRAVGASGVNRSQLATGGWSPIVDGARNTVEAPLEPFARPGANHLIMLSREPEAKSFCTVIARVSSQEEARSTLGAIQKALQAIDAKVPAARSGEGVIFLSSPRFAQVDLMTGASGTKEQPGLRIVVGYQIAEKK